MDKYSELFQTLHDEKAPVGYLGRGTHYSVFRAEVSQDLFQRPLQKAIPHDFAVIWDEDHDPRIIKLIERICSQGLLTPIKILGERKGSLSIILDDRFLKAISNYAVEKYQSQIDSIADTSEDPWSVDFLTLSNPEGIIAANLESVKLYLKTIDMLWQLGIQKI